MWRAGARKGSEMRILEYFAENFKGLRLVEFKPTGRVTVFTGANGAGKTSALDVVPAVLGGAKCVPEMPVRKGATHWKGRLVLGDDKSPEMTVQRTQSGVTLTMAGGLPAWDTPQAMLRKIYDERSFDPTEFVRLKPEEQVEYLRKAVGVDDELKALDQADKDDYKERENVNREVRRLEGEVQAITVQAGLPEHKIDEERLQAQLREASEQNRTIAGQIEQRAELAAALERAERGLQAHQEFIAAKEKAIAQLGIDGPQMEAVATQAGVTNDVLVEHLSFYQSRRWPAADVLVNALTSGQQAATRLKNDAQMRAEEINRELRGARAALEAARATLQSMDDNVGAAREAWETAPAGQLIDTSALGEEIRQAGITNREIDKRSRREGLVEQLEEERRKSHALTRAMDGREEKRRAAVSGAKMPVEGLTIADGKVLFNGIPLRQLGEAQQILLSIRIVLARSPKLRLVRIDHGEALDDGALAMLYELMEELDCTAWISKVDTTGKVGIYLEDGEIKAVNS